MPNLFKFKEFSVNQSAAAMKIGTDGVLLGAWVDISYQPNSILDVGAGTGLIALMLAQRSTAETIDAVEVEDQAYIQSVDNFENSPWSDRLFCYHADFVEFCEEMQGETYDLIISNPPYFEEPNIDSKLSEGRKKARFTLSLSLETLINGAATLLSQEGRLTIVIPYTEEEHLVELAKKMELFPMDILRVKGRENTPIKRSLITFGFKPTLVNPEELIIEISRHNYTKDYINLTKDFYLKM